MRPGSAAVHPGWRDGAPGDGRTRRAAAGARTAGWLVQNKQVTQGCLPACTLRRAWRASLMPMLLPTACYSRRRRAKTKLRFLALAHVSPTTSTTSRSTCIRTCSTRGKRAAVCALRWLPPCLSSVEFCLCDARLTMALRTHPSNNLQAVCARLMQHGTPVGTLAGR